MTHPVNIDLDQFRADWEAGILIKVLADKYGCSVSHIENLRRTSGLPARYQAGVSPRANKVAIGVYLDPSVHRALYAAAKTEGLSATKLAAHILTGFVKGTEDGG